MAPCTGTDGLKWPSVIHEIRFSGAWAPRTQGKVLLNSGCGISYIAFLEEGVCEDN